MASVPATTFVCLNRCLLDLLLNLCLFPYKYCKMLIVNVKYYRSNISVSEFWVHVLTLFTVLSENTHWPSIYKGLWLIQCEQAGSLVIQQHPVNTITPASFHNFKEILSTSKSLPILTMTFVWSLATFNLTQCQAALWTITPQVLYTSSCNITLIFSISKSHVSPMFTFVWPFKLGQHQMAACDLTLKI